MGEGGGSGAGGLTFIASGATSSNREKLEGKRGGRSGAGGSEPLRAPTMTQPGEAFRGGSFGGGGSLPLSRSLIGDGDGDEGGGSLLGLLGAGTGGFLTDFETLHTPDDWGNVFPGRGGTPVD